MLENDIIEFSRCHLMQSITTDEIRTAVEMLHPTVAEFPAKSLIFSTEKFSPALIYILSGELSVERKEAGKRVLLNQLGAGDCFGMASMFGGDNSFPTSVKARTNVRIAAVDETGLTDFFTAYPRTAIAHIQYLSEKIRFLNKKISALTGRDAESKVSNYIYKTYGKQTCQGKLNMTETSRKLDIGRASLYRIIKQLCDENIISYSNGLIEIKNIKELERLSK